MVPERAVTYTFVAAPRTLHAVQRAKFNPQRLFALSH